MGALIWPLVIVVIVVAVVVVASRVDAIRSARPVVWLIGIDLLGRNPFNTIVRELAVEGAERIRNLPRTVRAKRSFLDDYSLEVQFPGPSWDLVMVRPVDFNGAVVGLLTDYLADDGIAVPHDFDVQFGLSETAERIVTLRERGETKKPGQIESGEPGNGADPQGRPVAILEVGPHEEPYECRAGQTLVVGYRDRAIGRVHIPIADPTVSRTHCAFVVTGTGGLQVRDANSTYGTFVNGNRTAGSVTLKHGDIVRVGETEIRVVIPIAGEREAAVGGRLPRPETGGAAGSQPGAGEHQEALARLAVAPDRPSVEEEPAPAPARARTRAPEPYEHILEQGPLDGIVLGQGSQGAMRWRVAGWPNAELLVAGESRPERSRTTEALIRALPPSLGVFVLDADGLLSPDHIDGLRAYHPAGSAIPFNPLAVESPGQATLLRELMLDAFAGGTGAQSVDGQWRQRLSSALRTTIVDGRSLAHLGTLLLGRPDADVFFGRLLDASLFDDGPPLGRITEHRSAAYWAALDQTTASAATMLSVAALTAWLEETPPSTRVTSCLAITGADLIAPSELLDRLRHAAARAGTAVIMVGASPPRGMHLSPSAMICFRLAETLAARASRIMARDHLTAQIMSLDPDRAVLRIGNDDPAQVRPIGYLT